MNVLVTRRNTGIANVLNVLGFDFRNRGQTHQLEQKSNMLLECNMFLVTRQIIFVRTILFAFLEDTNTIFTTAEGAEKVMKQ